MIFSLLRLEQHNDIATLTLARGEKANALSSALVDELHEAFNRIDKHATRVLAIRGEGNNFCAGFDLLNLNQETDETLIARLVRAEELLQAIYYAPFATIALIHGGAYGAGFDLAMACDYRITSADAKFRMPSWKMGIAIGTRRLVSRVGVETSFQCLRSAAVLDAQTALREKFVTEMADTVTWPRRVEEIANHVRAMPYGAYAQLKRIALPDTREADRFALLESLTREPLKQRMEKYVKTVQ
ncbi:MAG: enoyl-CoA hydratase/isomerase family protein [Casimicrobium sp.]